MAGSLTSDSSTPEAAPYVTRRVLELATALTVALLGLIVVAESVTHDIGWNETGPGSGYFPFRVGLLLTAASLLRAWQSVRGAGPADASIGFVTREELKRSLSVFWPTAALVIAMFPLGCYVPSGVYLAWMMRRHGGHGWLLSAAYGAAVMVAFFLVFDLWFRVPLAKGPLEAAFGL
jgi:putative tricarboxylic transport membrane protein